MSDLWSEGKEMANTERIGARNCPILERTGDGRPVGRCWFYLQDGKTCPRHGDVGAAVATYLSTGNLTLENLEKAMGRDV